MHQAGCGKPAHQAALIAPALHMVAMVANEARSGKMVVLEASCRCLRELDIVCSRKFRNNLLIGMAMCFTPWSGGAELEG